MASKVDKEAKLAALMMQALMMTPDGGMAEFRKKRLGRANEQPLERIRVVRDLALVLAGALHSDDDEMWERVARAAALLDAAGDAADDIDDRAITQPPPDEADTTVSLRTPPTGSPRFVMPFPAPPPSTPGDAVWQTKAGEPPMSLPHYAAMSACCAAFPAQVAETHAKFGIKGRQDRLSLDAAWRERFDNDPRTAELYDALVLELEAWLVRYRGL